MSPCVYQRSPPLRNAKFHPHRCSVSPLRGEKPQNRPLSNLNTGALRCAQCAGTANNKHFATSWRKTAGIMKKLRHRHRNLCRLAYVKEKFEQIRQAECIKPEAKVPVLNKVCDNYRILNK